MDKTILHSQNFADFFFFFCNENYRELDLKDFFSIFLCLKENQIIVIFWSDLVKSKSDLVKAGPSILSHSMNRKPSSS